MLTSAQIRSIFPKCSDPDVWAAALPPALTRFGIDSPPRVAAFLAQVGHESGQFDRLVESLFYRTAGRLVAVWPKRFRSEAAAQPFVANEAKLGNFVYALRMGNGDFASGDGFRYRGRGLIQLTGRSNYVAASEALGLDLAGQPDLLKDPDNAASSAAWFWKTRGLNELADDRTDDDDLEDFREITRRVNGGTVGLKERLALLNEIEHALGNRSIARSPAAEDSRSGQARV